MDPQLSDSANRVENGGCPHLLLLWRGRTVRLNGHTQERLSIGSRRGCDLLVPSRFASRDHACLEWRRNQFHLVDRSTNGTFVQLEDEHLSFVHRSSIRLWGTGFLSFGEPLSPENVLKFSHA